MNLYYRHIHGELEAWHKNIIKPKRLLTKISDGIQSQTRKLIPQKVQNMITATLKTFTQAVMSGSRFVTKLGDTADLTLAESDYLVAKKFQSYRTTAISEGAITGAGSFLVGLADLPALLGIKIKFLFDCAALYGYDVNDPNERLFMLYVFQLAFSRREHRIKCFENLADWDNKPPAEIDWEAFQTEYRDYLDIAKLLQLMPVIGAPVGAIANNGLMERLRDNVMNADRMRKLGKTWENK
jgi:hypothetical protein